MAGCHCITGTCEFILGGGEEGGLGVGTTSIRPFP